MDEQKSYNAENGFTVSHENNGTGPFYTGGQASPLGQDLSVNTFYIQNTSTGTVLWRKWGPQVIDWTKVKANDFYQYVESLGQTDYNSNASYQTKLTLTTPTVVAGTYRIQVNWIAWVDGLLGAGNHRIQLNGADLFARALDTNQNSFAQTIIRQVVLTSAAHTFTLQFNRSSGTAHILAATMEFSRVE